MCKKAAKKRVSNLRWHLVLILSAFSLCASSFATIKPNNLGSSKTIKYQHLDALSLSHQQKIKEWISFGITSNELVLGEPFQSYYQFDLKPRYFSTEPVPWARIVRGTPDTVELHFNRYASLVSLKNDWTLYHELSHLYHPLFDYSDFWLGEGLATYLQNIVMFKNNLINRDEFYTRIKAGLSRGKVNTKINSGRLSDISENMWQLKAHQRMYWSGVAFFIEAEHALKALNKPSLVALIKQYQHCCAINAKAHTGNAGDFLSELDKLSRSGIFTSLYRRYRDREDFPEITDPQIKSLIAPSTFKL